MKPIILATLLALILTSTSVRSDDGERSFLLCEGASLKDSADGFSFTVTLDIQHEKVMSIGSGEGAVTEAFTDTEIIGKQDVGVGVTNRLTIDRGARTFSLVILRAKAKESASDPVAEDEFRGTCTPTTKAF